MFAIDKHGLRGMALIELAPASTLDEIAAKTEASLPGGARLTAAPAHAGVGIRARSNGVAS